MSEEIPIKTKRFSKESILKNFRIENTDTIKWTLLYSIIGVGVFLLLSLIPESYYIIELFKFGLFPAIAIITLFGAIRGPISGLITGYLGTILHDLLFYSSVVTFTLPALAYGLLGFLVGVFSYDLSNGKSLVKLTIISAIGFIITIILILVIGVVIEGYAVLVAIGFLTLPLLTYMLPSVILLTPVFARIYQLIKDKFNKN